MINLYIPSKAQRLPLAPSSAGANERMLVGFHSAATTPHIQMGFSSSAETHWMVDCPIKMFIPTIYFTEILQYFSHLSGFLDLNIDRNFNLKCINYFLFHWKFKN